ncbi:hypothetical protein RvY_11349-2 [Ramazzottius varieornatus]|uniref:Uncharacterized protein n=1 Tax=Ramazzottius varieornatus TaxID=947166 RepID=A0A1D1VFW2_RAMVA|nr:hypothetical protein RvY_11349-2 [Ramazzottius varieornatus]
MFGKKFSPSWIYGCVISCPGVDKDWKNQLKKSGSLNSGIVFLDCRVSMESRWTINGVFETGSIRFVTDASKTLAPLDLGPGITHIVIIDDWKSKVRPFDLFKPFGSLKDSLKKFTIIGRWFIEMSLIITANFCLDENLELQLLRCRIPLSFPDIRVFTGIPQWEKVKWYSIRRTRIYPLEHHRRSGYYSSSTARTYCGPMEKTRWNGWNVQ